MSVTVLVVDDHPLVRSGFRFLAESRPEIELIGEAASASEAVELALRLCPDVIVLDIELGDGNGIDAAHQIRSVNPTAKVLFVTMHGDEATVMAALHAGASGYVMKGAHQDELVRAILGAASGELLLGPQAAAILATRIHEIVTVTSEFPYLTDRENQVLDLMAAGQPNGSIASRLGVTRKTVANHVTNILSKLHAADRGQAIVMARRSGYGNDRRRK